MTEPKPKPMTGPEHVREALRLAELSEQKDIALPGGTGFYAPSDEQRYRMLMRAHLHASLARTAAMVDSKRYDAGLTCRSRSDEAAWHEVFAVSE